MKKLSQRDPIRASQRRATVGRRFGEDAQCACGENRPEALIPNSKPSICAECQRRNAKRSLMDNHHVAAKANSTVTIPIPVNEHRAVLSTAQYDWPKDTLENPDGSPLLKGAACIRGTADTVIFLITFLLAWIPSMLEALDSQLIEERGPEYWHNTELDNFAPRRSDVGR